MKYLFNFTNLASSDYIYGGNSGLKRGIIFNNEPWFLKFLWSNDGAIKEYIGSHIYEILGLKVQETKLGMFLNKENNKTYLVVACKDFCKNDYELIDYTMIKNHIFTSDSWSKNLMNSLPKYKNNDIAYKTISIEEIIVNIKNNDICKQCNGFNKQFWDMLIVDCLIANHSRTRDDFGILRSKITNQYSLSPIYDNDGAFINNHLCPFSINSEMVDYPMFFKLLKSKNLDKDFNKSLLCLMPIIQTKFNDFIEFINSIPYKEDDIVIITNDQKTSYIECLKNNLKILLDVYKTIK